jgi:antitoxin component of RelBE/YafQ-DinJ toxin-antitoxin module
MRRTETVRIRVSGSERERWREAADRAELKLSELIRLAVRETLRRPEFGGDRWHEVRR